MSEKFEYNFVTREGESAHLYSDGENLVLVTSQEVGDYHLDYVMHEYSTDIIDPENGVVVYHQTDGDDGFRD